MLRFLFPSVAVAALLIAGCKGPATNPVVIPTTAPTGAPTTIPVGPTPSSDTLTGSGYSLTFLVPGIVSGSGSVTATLSATLPAGVVAPSSQSRGISSIGAPGARRTQSGISPVSPLVYLSVIPSANITFATLPGFTYTLPSTVSVATGSQAYTEFYDPANSTWLPALGPGAVSGQTITFPSVAGAVSLKAATTYLYALVVTVSPSPSPTPSPSTAPTATPTPGTTPTPTPTPTPAPPGVFATCTGTGGTTFPMVIRNDTTLASSGMLNVYVYGAVNGTPTSPIDYLQDATSGTLQPLPAVGAQVPSFSVASNTCINLPPLVSARVIVVLNGQVINLPVVQSATTGLIGVAAPVAGNGIVHSADANTVNNIWDFLEYSWTGGSSQFNIDTSQVDAIGIPISFQAVNTVVPNPQPIFGMQPRAVTNIAAALNGLGGYWTGLVQQTGTAGVARVISPQHAQNIAPDAPYPPPTSPTPAPAAPAAQAATFNASFYDAIISNIWSTYTPANPLYLYYNGPIQSGTYGYVNPTTNMFTFYASSGTQIAQIAYPTTWAVFNNAGAFTSSSGSSGTGTSATDIGRALVVGIERGTIGLPGALSGASNPQPLCGMSQWSLFYGGSATSGGINPTNSVTVNWYSALMHKYGQAPFPGLPGLAYAFPDDDECQTAPPNPHGQYDPDTGAVLSAGEQWNVTLNPI